MTVLERSSPTRTVEVNEYFTFCSLDRGIRQSIVTRNVQNIFRIVFYEGMLLVAYLSLLLKP